MKSHNFSKTGNLVTGIKSVTIKYRLRLGLDNNKTLRINVFDIKLIPQ